MSTSIEGRLDDSAPVSPPRSSVSGEPGVAPPAESSNAGASAPAFADSEREQLQARMARSEQLLQEAAERGGSVPQENAGLFRSLLQFLLRIKSRIANMLRGTSGPNEYSRAADEMDGARTPQQMADIAKQSSFASKNDRHAVAQMTDEALQSKVGALLQAHSGLDGAEAAVYATLASSQYKPSPEQEDIIAAAMESQAQAIENLSIERQSLLDQIRQALRVRGDVSLDVDKMNLHSLAEMAKAKNLPDVIKLCEHCKREDGELEMLKMGATKTYEHAWMSMMPMERLQGAASRIWSSDEQEKILHKFGRDHKDEAKQRELLDQSQVAARHVAPEDRGAAGQSMALMSSGNGDELRRRAAQDAQDVAKRKAAQAEVQQDEERLTLQAQRQAASAANDKRAQSLAAAGQGRVLGSDGKPLSDAERSSAQKAAQDAISKAKGVSDTVATVSTVAPVVAAINPAAGAALATAGKVAVGASAALNLAKLRANAQAGLSPDEIGKPMPTENDPYNQANATVRAYAAKAGQIKTDAAPANDDRDDGGAYPSDAPKPG